VTDAGASSESGRPARPRTIFLGSGRFALPILNALIESPAVDLIGVVTRAPRPAGRGGMMRPSPVGVIARSKWLALLTPWRLRDEESVAEALALQPELLVLADYGQVVPAQLVESPVHGALNVHPSLLPRYRGASPIPAAILAGDDHTGVSIIRMDRGVDTGPIVAQERVELTGSELAPELVDRLAGVGAALLGRTLEPWISGRLSARPQDEGGASLTRPLRRHHGFLDPTHSAAELARQVRGYQPWPGSFIQADGGRIIVWAASAVEGAQDDEPGTLVADGDGLSLVVSDGVLRLQTVQPAGGRRMSSAELRRGRPGLVGSRVGRSAIG
jgi:methionyl-tRNA formyltransferase